MSKNKDVIDFKKLAGRTYIGRPRGKLAREHFEISQYDQGGGVSVEVLFPDNVKTMSSSFFLGMFGDSVVKAESEEEFKKRFKFIAKPQILKQIDEAISRAITSMSFVR